MLDDFGIALDCQARRGEVCDSALVAPVFIEPSGVLVLLGTNSTPPARHPH